MSSGADSTPAGPVTYRQSNETSRASTESTSGGTGATEAKSPMSFCRHLCTYERKKSKYFTLCTDEEMVLILAFIGGFVDAVGYLSLQGLFTSSITGNLVAACAAIYQTKGVLARVFVSLAFFVTNFIATTVSLRLRLVNKWPQTLVSAVVFALEVVCLAVAIGTGVAYKTEVNNAENLDDWSVSVVGSLMGAAMGFHNAAAKETIVNCPSTTVMTMTLVTLANHSSNVLSYFLASNHLMQLVPKGATEGARETYIAKYTEFSDKCVVTVKPLVLFLLGSLVGAATIYNWSFWCLFVALGFVVVIIFDLLLTYHLQSAEARAKGSPPPAASSKKYSENLSQEYVKVSATEPSSTKEVEMTVAVQGVAERV